MLPTARLDEHRLAENTIGPVCAFGEQRRPTALMPFPVWALDEHGRRTTAIPSSLPFGRVVIKALVDNLAVLPLRDRHLLKMRILVVRRNEIHDGFIKRHIVTNA
jgi:hypothetical protein